MAKLVWSDDDGTALSATHLPDFQFNLALLRARIHTNASIGNLDKRTCQVMGALRWAHNKAAASVVACRRVMSALVAVDS